MTQFAPCDNCSGEIIVGKFDTITVPRLDADGLPTLAPNGGFVTIRLSLPAHRANHYAARQPFDPTGLAPALCGHGLPEHPDGLKHPFAVSWIRAKYLNPRPPLHCPVCRGETPPADMLTPRNAS